MRHRHPYENRYCTGCQCTTRHEVKETCYACLRCGAIKYPVKAVIRRQPALAAGQ
ncbi:MAG TPA: hypothetical protein VHU81_21070 [Thermoanaerobaculia bacterium]|jgi:hypothetical protein|nr:hypothetical protein [Thermoanaerobaculia bacterium]